MGYLAQWRITIRRRWLDDGRVCVVTRRSNFPKINLCRATHLTLLARRRRRLAAASEIMRRQRLLFAEWRNWATAALEWQRAAVGSAAFAAAAPSLRRLRVEIVALFLKTNVAPTIGIWCKQHCSGPRYNFRSEFQLLNSNLSATFATGQKWLLMSYQHYARRCQKVQIYGFFNHLSKSKINWILLMFFPMKLGARKLGAMDSSMHQFGNSYEKNYDSFTDKNILDNSY